MQVQTFLDFMHAIEKLKCNTRHSWTSNGRPESVAEHSWRLAVMAMLCRNEYPDADVDKVIRMCLVHDFGEAITGDIPAFLKNKSDEQTEQQAVEVLLQMLPQAEQDELRELFAEMEALETTEARLYKALDNMEALISHNEADISTWLPREYTLNLSYGEKNTAFSPWTQALKAAIDCNTREKIAFAQNETEKEPEK